MKSGVIHTTEGKFQDVLYDLIEQGGYLCSAAETERLRALLGRTSGLDAALYGIGAVTADGRKFLICTEPVRPSGVPVVQLLCGAEQTEVSRGTALKVDSESIEQIVKQVLSELDGHAPAAGSRGGAAPDRARVAMLTQKEHFELQEYPIPEIGDDDILVNVEGCGV